MALNVASSLFPLSQRHKRVYLTYKMKSSINAKCLEFDNIVIDLTDVKFEENCNDSELEEYIIFMIIKNTVYKNFHIKCDLSLETFAVFVYEQSSITVQQKKIIKPLNFVDIIYFNNNDNDNSIILDFGINTQIIVAKKIYPSEKYHQRVNGFLDFQKRNNVPTPDIVTNQELRNILDRELESKLYQLSFQEN